MAEPFDSIKSYLEKHHADTWAKIIANRGVRNVYGIKLSRDGNAIYIGNDDEHITLLSYSEGMHHSYNDGQGHVTGVQRSSLVTIDDIIKHIKYNPKSYKNEYVLKTLEWLYNNMR
jgi:hypothetical protein